MLQHLDHLWQLWVPPAELPEDTDTSSEAFRVHLDLAEDTDVNVVQQ